jgi:chromate transporter
MDPVGLGRASRVWLGIGVNSFGGPAGQLAVMHEELVERRRWLGERRFLHALNYAMVLPGPEAQQLVTYVGWLLNGVRGGLIAGGLFILPGFLVMLVLSAVYALYGDLPLVAGLLLGLQAAVIAIVVQAVVRVGRRTLKTPFLVLLAAAAFGALFAFGVPFPLVVLGAGAIGWAVGARHPDLLADTGALEHFPGTPSRGYLLPEDEAVGPERAVAARRAALACLVVWLLPIVGLRLALGPAHVLAQEAALFGRTALVTFGGAYAVLSYVSAQAVGVYGWITPADMTAGLGLAETTPGPLILVLQFVGFLAAFDDPGSLPPLVAGVVGACVTVWVTFVPCFMFIFAGAPYVERLRRSRPLHHALRSVSAAVVGVILNLAVWFALSTLFGTVVPHSWGPVTVPVPVLSSIDWAAAGMAGLAVALVSFQRLSPPRVLAVCAGVGVLGSLFS